MIEITIPTKRRKRKYKKSNEYYHYELVKVYPNHVVYKCLETGKLESFSKKEFITKVEIGKENII